MNTEDKENKVSDFIPGKLYPQYEPIGENSEEDLVVINCCNNIIRRVYNEGKEQFLGEISPKQGNYLKGVKTFDSGIGYIFIEHDFNLDGAFPPC